MPVVWIGVPTASFLMESKRMFEYIVVVVLFTPVLVCVKPLLSVFTPVPVYAKPLLSVFTK